jgi:hypothetical protein
MRQHTLVLPMSSAATSPDAFGRPATRDRRLTLERNDVHDARPSHAIGVSALAHPCDADRAGRRRRERHPARNPEIDDTKPLVEDLVTIVEVAEHCESLFDTMFRQQDLDGPVR